MIENSYYLISILLGIILLSVWLDSRFKWARKISPVMMIFLLAGFASNLGLITSRSPFYDNLVGFAVPFAVCLILFTVNLKDLRKYGGPLLAAFAIACLATIVGVLMSGLLFNVALSKILGAESWKLAGPFAGTYIGGNLNFFAMWNGLGIGNPDLFAAANAVDNLTLIPLFAIWVLVPRLFGKWYPVSSKYENSMAGPGHGIAATDNDKTVTAEEQTKKTELRILDVVALSFAAIAIIVLSDLIKDLLIAPFFPAFPTILIITTLAIILAQFKFIDRLQGASEISNISFYIFFCAVGAMSDIKMIIVLSPVLFAYAMTIILIHMVFIYGFGRLFLFDIRILTIASVAAVTGPPIVVALANVHGWKNLILPGVAMGLLGYAIGNYLGFAAAYAMKALLGM